MKKVSYDGTELPVVEGTIRPPLKKPSLPNRRVQERVTMADDGS